MTDSYIIEEFTPETIGEIYSLIHQLNPELTAEDFSTRLQAMWPEGYRCIGIYAMPDKTLVGCSGFWTGTRFWCGKFIEPDNVVIHRDWRGRGIGNLLMEWIEQEGIRLNCQLAKLETYAVNEKSRAFYRERSYGEPGIVMVKPLLISEALWQEQLKSKAK